MSTELGWGDHLNGVGGYNSKWRKGSRKQRESSKCLNNL